MGAVLATLLPAAALMLPGCSSVPDAVNPIEWYKGTTEWVAGDGEDEAKGEAAADAPQLSTEGVPGEDGTFPNLASVPERPEPQSTFQDREEIAEGLIADHQNATYGAKIVASPGIEVPPPPPPALAIVEGTAPAPVAVIAPSLAPPSPVPVPQPAPAPTIIQTPSQPTPPAATSVAPPAPVPNVPVPQPMVPAPTMTVAPAESAEYLIASSTAPVGIARGLAILDLDRAGTGQPVAVVFFANGSARLSANDQVVLGKVAEVQRAGGGSLRVVGHASSPTNAKNLVGQRLINFEVSLDRASAATEELVRHGVPAMAIHSDAVSANRPVTNESLPGGEASNRRVEIFLDY